MRILAIDIGSKAGFAYTAGGPRSSWVAGTWELATDAELDQAKKLRLDRRLDIRVANFVRHLETFRRVSLVEAVVFEDVKFAKSQAQAHLWASYRGALWSFAARHHVDIDCLDVQKLKLFATGNGWAKKEDMARAWKRKYPERSITGLDDNAVDALHLLDWANSLFNK